jgi:type I restriction enzyme S subunit
VITGLKPYPATKDSGVPWLGEVPEHWKVRRFKYVLRERDVRSAAGSEQLLRVSQFTGVTERKRADGSDEPDTRAESLVGYKLVDPDDLVVNIMLAWNGSMGVSRFPGIASPAYCVYRFGTSAQPWYFHHLLRSAAYKARIKAVSTGVVESRLRLYTDDLYRLEALLPPLPEQAAIVRFLDQADRRIRWYIRTKQKLIKLLEEQKQAIIHRAVTRGLDPDVRLKPSGVEWLGKVPEHWEVRRLRSLAHIKTGDRDTVDRVDDGEYPFFVRSQIVERINSWSFDGEAVLTAGDGAGVAKVFHFINGKFDYHQRVYKFSGFRGILGRFFFEYFRATLRFEALAGNAKSTVDSLRLPMLQNFPVVIPRKEEQAAIVGHVKEAAASIAATTTRTRHEIELLREYGTRLIADVVTGKLDVREAAARLPVEIDQPEPLDDSASMGEATESMGEKGFEAEVEEAEA